MTPVNIKEKLALNTYKTGKTSHLKVKKELCKDCTIRCCLTVCPARVYSLDEQNEIRIEFEGCLECGTCLIACPREAIEWSYPEGGLGVQFKYG